jgi:hypothetical protein
MNVPQMEQLRPRSNGRIFPVSVGLFRVVVTMQPSTIEVPRNHGDSYVQIRQPYQAARTMFSEPEEFSNDRIPCPLHLRHNLRDFESKFNLLIFWQQSHVSE